MRDNPVQFAVVREDPNTELRTLLGKHPKRILSIGSGGCTALALSQTYPDTEIILVEPNEAQIALIQQKAHALENLQKTEKRARFNIAPSEWIPETFISPDRAPGLNNSGNFESLFHYESRF